ncbi:MAG: tRNA (guanosine(37)-N1)-methyltransferase TrmD, partial [Desulfovibrio sp.]|nr:tRNA (guanosine(37)-N1)-methyltransferase TrmD [Desulfovibrio sp.]
MPVFNIVTLFPEFFDSPLKTGLMGKAVASGLVSFNFFNPRDFSLDKHRRVDDRPFGGGAGMLMTLQPLCSALEAIPNPGPLLLMSPQGAPFAQKDAVSFAKEKSLTIICPRYEGADARLEELFPTRAISVCDAVLNGGETAALAIIEAVARLIPGFMGKEESAREESFSDGLLEYQSYTRPETFRGISAPRVLLNGNRAEIARLRRQSSLLRTLRIRPDLLSEAPMRASDAAFLKTVPRL